MAWIKVDDKFTSGPKVKRAARALAGKHPKTRIIAAWLQILSYCNLHETDGFIPDYEVEDFDDANPKQVCQAMAAGSGETPGPILERDEARKGWVVRNYAEYQPTRAELESKREQDRLRKLSKRIPRGQSADPERTNIGSRHPDPARPDPDRSGPAQPQADAGRPTARPGGAMGSHETLIDGPWMRKHGQHVRYPSACQVGACIHPSQHQEFTAALSVCDGRGPDGRTIDEFYADTVAEIEQGGTPVSDTFRFWRAAFERWVGPVTRVESRGNRAVAAGQRLEAALRTGATLDTFGVERAKALESGAAATGILVPAGRPS